jgi:hypothetical protein
MVQQSIHVKTVVPYYILEVKGPARRTIFANSCLHRFIETNCFDGENRPHAFICSRPCFNAFSNRAIGHIDGPEQGSRPRIHNFFALDQLRRGTIHKEEVFSMSPTDYEQWLIEQAGITTPDEAQQFIRFAWRCIHRTPLAGGLTPLGRLWGRSRLQKALLAVECWLEGEAVEGQLRAMHGDVFEAALGMGRFEYHMTGLRAACWSVFELYQAVLAAESGDFQMAVRKAASAATLACRAGDGGPTPVALEYQERLLGEAFAVSTGRLA